VTRRKSTEGSDSRASDRLPTPRTRVAFSLFEGDLVNRGFDAIGLRSRRGIDLILRSLLLMGATWGVVAIAALMATQYRGVPASENFFEDFAAYLQFIIGLPLFVVAEYIVSEHTREAANYFLVSGVVPSADIPLVEALHRRIERLRKSTVPDVLCIILAYSLAFATIWPKTTSICPSWHTTPNPESDATVEQIRQEQRTACSELLRQRQAEMSTHDAMQGGAIEPAAEPKPKRYPSQLNLAGWLEMLVALPVLNYWWLRWIWKILLWTWYLWRTSRRHLVLTPAHPDATGGIGFISDVQSKFGFVILAYGISNIASSVAYEIGVEHASWSLYTVWCPLLIFVVASPALFTLPLFMFTKQLYRAKKRVREELYEKAGERARAFESAWRGAEPGVTLQNELFAWQQLRHLFEHVEEMRIVPFDLRSLSELLGQTLGSLVPLLAYLNLPEWITKLLESTSHWFHSV
jgi:hypothetical protein